MDKRFFDRIHYHGKLDDISLQICERYGLGRLKDNKLIPVGYEDFNFRLDASDGAYFVKVFAKSRSIKDCKRYVQIMERALEAGVSTPALLKSPEGYLFTPKIGDARLRLCITSFIEGADLFALNKTISHADIKFLSQQAAKINSINLKPKFIYDSWAITNFLREYKEKGDKLSQKDRVLVEPLVQQFKDLGIKDLPNCFVHGDIISPNVIRDKRGSLWIIDFSCSNYAPRIQELAVLACGLFLDKRKETSQKNLRLALKEYQKRIKLTSEELIALPVYIQLAHAMHILRANYEKVANRNRTKENEYFLGLGRMGLEQMIS